MRLTFSCHEDKMETFCSEENGKLAQALLKLQRQLQPVLRMRTIPSPKAGTRH